MESLLQSKQVPEAAGLGALALAAAWVIWSVVAYIRSPLRKYPGPFLAGWTNLWRLHLVSTHKYQWTIKTLHEKHGPVVRIGPNLLDLDYPELIKTIYGTDGKWKKTDFYKNSSTVVDGKITYHLFSETDQAIHARMKRPIIKYYSMSNVLTLEKHLDGVVADFCRHLETRFMEKENHGKACDLGQWIAFYAWDFITSATFSKRFGYMDKACDFDNTMRIADQVTDYFATVGQMPFLDFLLDKNPIRRIGPPNLGNVNRISVEHLTARLQETAADGYVEKKAEDKDFLDHFIDAKHKSPAVVDDLLIIGYLMDNMLAGADTTAITMRAVFHFLLTNPAAFDTLEAEIQGAGLDGDAVVSYSAARALPYLDAVLRESMRLHPGVGMPLERYVPAGGLHLPDGRGFLPAGTGIGINPYIVGRNEAVWGADANDFRPERWLPRAGESDADFQQRLRRMNGADLTFGGGSRICIGRNIAMLEAYKVVATLIRKYRIRPAAGPGGSMDQFTILSTWFPRQSGLICRLEKRAD